MTNKLKPCPFCGGEGEIRIVMRSNKPDGYWIRCQNCMAAIDVYNTQYESVIAWNRRANNE